MYFLTPVNFYGTTLQPRVVVGSALVTMRIRIRIQHWRTSRIRIHRFELKKFVFFNFFSFCIQNFNIFIRRAPWRRQICSRSLQSSKENIQHFKTWFFFSFLWFFFALLDPDKDSHSQFGSGSTFLILTLSGSNSPKAMQIPVDLDTQNCL